MRRNLRFGIAALAIALPLVFAASAQATPGSAETLSIQMQATSYPTGPPWVATNYGTFTASGAFDASGTVSFKVMWGAAVAPATAVPQLWDTLTDTQGDTLDLRCSLFANDFSDLAAIPFRGTCVVHEATGPFASLQGSGKVSGFVHDLVSPQLWDETVAIPTR